VVTQTPAVTGTLWARAIWASPVPGGMSKISTSSSPQRISSIICSIAWVTIAPFQISDASGAINDPILITLIPWATIGLIFCPMKTGWTPSIPIIRGIFGP
jgi:hypothetical protein